MAEQVVQLSRFTYNPATNMLVGEAAEIEHDLGQRGGMLAEFSIQGRYHRIRYRICPTRTVYDASQEDVIAHVYAAVGHPALPLVHVLND